MIFKLTLAFALLAFSSAQCTSHSDCTTDQYCDTAQNCWSLSSCGSFCDAIDGVCPDGSSCTPACSCDATMNSDGTYSDAYGTCTYDQNSQDLCDSIQAAATTLGVMFILFVVVL